MHSQDFFFHIYKIKFSLPKELSINSNKNQIKTIKGREITCDGKLKNRTLKPINPK